MPLINNRSIALQPLPVIGTKKGPGVAKFSPVWVIEETGEVFTHYSDFCYKVLLYRKKIWTCQWTDKKNLTYYQALNSEFETEVEILQNMNKTLREQVIGLVFDGPDYLKLLAELVHQELHGPLKVGDRVTWLEGHVGAQGKIIDIQNANKGKTKDVKYTIQSDSNLIFSVDFDNLKRIAPYLAKMDIQNILQFIKKCSKTPGLKKYFSDDNKVNSSKNILRPTSRVDYISRLNIHSPSPKERKGTPSFVIDSTNYSERDTIGSGSPDPYYKERTPIDGNGHLSVPINVTGSIAVTSGSETVSPKLSNISIGKFKGSEDLRFTSNPQKPIRPALISVPITCPKLLALATKIWTFTNSFHSSLDFDQLPLFNIIEFIDQSTDFESENRFEIEYLVMAFLNLIVPDAHNISSQWFPLNSESPKTSVDFLVAHLGDWRKITPPLKACNWGRTLFGCLKQLATDIVLPNAQSIISHLEGTQDAPDALKFSENIEELVKTNIQDGFQAIKKTRGNRGKTVNDPATELETEFQTRFYRLCTADKLYILSFLVEQANGSTKIREAIEDRVEERTALKRDKSDLQKIVRSRVDELTMINRNIQELETTLSPYLDNHDSSPVSSPNSLSNGKRPLDESTSAPQLTRMETKALRKQLDKLKTSQRDVEVINEENDERLDKLENQINMQFDLLRFKAIGQDRFLNRYYFAFGCVSLPDSEDGPKILVEHCLDLDTLSQLSGINREELASRWKTEIGTDPEQHPKPWGYFNTLDQVKQLIEWLNPNGLREKVLKNGIEAVLDAFEETETETKEES